MSSADTWIYGTILRHAPNPPYAAAETLVMFIRWEQKNVRERTPILLVLADGAAPEIGAAMTGYMAPIKIHPSDWEVVG